MARCEDFPCCGHEAGCCPDYDESGRQLNMVCICGAKLPINSRYSLCDSCLSSGDEYDPDGRFFDDRDDDDFDDEGKDESDEPEYAPDAHLEDYGDFGYDGCHEE